MNPLRKPVAILRSVLVAIFVAGCDASPQTVTQPTPVRFSSISDVLQQRPPTGTVLEIDAYYGPYVPGTYIPLAQPDEIGCPRFPAALTDAPPLSCQPLTAGNYTCDGPTEGALFLQAVTPEQIMPGRDILPPRLPYHARFSGHLGDARLAHCPDADRIFVVDTVVQIYENDLPTRTPEVNK
jgi:hypothetical protein